MSTPGKKGRKRKGVAGGQGTLAKGRRGGGGALNCLPWLPFQKSSTVSLLIHADLVWLMNYESVSWLTYHLVSEESRNQLGRSN
jgi:hypothetical protein